ncbi:ribonuclease HI [Rothia mucilaginosa ATCC 25296]|uniref:RNase H family protein n=1 Tax=Rothia mucilaginosa TaxID=43675 RepID=UPI0001B0EF21|nr:ribonuclease HI [Rothia mucilaginosa ATCC 25296]
MNSTQEIIAAADGSALGNPGPAGWAWYIDDDHWASGGWAHGTNNMGELKAVLDLFEATASRPEAKLRVYCDSQYVINSLTKWMPGWKKKGWKKSDGKPVLNRDLLEALDQALTGRDYEFIWVKGHAGHELNEKADSLANGAARAYQEGREPAHGPGFGASAEPATVAVETPVAEAPIVNAPVAEPALSDVALSEVAFSEPEPSESSADAHLPVQEFTAAEIENAQRGVESLRLSGLLRPASAVNAPDPEAVRTRKEQLALAAERAAERDAKVLARQQETAQQASNAAQAEEGDDLTGLEEFAGMDPNDVDPAELLGETEGHAEEQAVEPAAAPIQDAPAQPAPSQPAEPAPSAPAAPAAPALNPEEAATAEQLLESRGSVMEAPQLESMLHERLVWVTATGKSVSRSSVLQYRERAFAQQGAPLKQGVQVLDSSSVLVMAAVATARGRVSRSSIWHYDAERGLWRLRFRQETPAS